MQTTPVTAADREAQANGLAAAREAFLADGKSLTIHSRDGTKKGKVVGNLDDRLWCAIEAYNRRRP